MIVEQYPLPKPDETGLTTVELPLLSEVLHAGAMNNGLEDVMFIWAMVDPKAPLERLSFRLVASGQRLRTAYGEELTHVSSFVFGRKMWHLFEIGEAS